MNRGTETEPHFIHVCISTFQQNPTYLGVYNKGLFILCAISGCKAHTSIHGFRSLVNRVHFHLCVLELWSRNLFSWLCIPKIPWGWWHQNLWKIQWNSPCRS